MGHRAKARSDQGKNGYEPRLVTVWFYCTIVVARGGIEPPTQGFSILCSTD